jgi:hypothetical protein
MASQPKSEAEDHRAFKRSIDKQNRLETARDERTKRARDHAEGQAAHRGIPAMERSSKGRPKRKQRG